MIINNVNKRIGCVKSVSYIKAASWKRLLSKISRRRRSQPHLCVLIFSFAHHLPHILWRLSASQKQSFVPLVHCFIIELETEFIEAQHELLDHESHLKFCNLRSSVFHRLSLYPSPSFLR